MARYRIKCDGYLLYDSYNDEYSVSEPELETSTNGSGSLKFKLPVTHKHYDKPKKITSIITAYQNEETIFKGRFMEDDWDFNNNRKIECEGAFSYFNDSVLTTYNYKGSMRGLLQLYIDRHNAQVEPYKRFKLGKVTVNPESGTGEILRASSQYPNTFKEIKEKLIDKLEGFFVLHYDTMTLDYLDAEDLPICSQKIEFGKNLLDLTSKLDGTEVATRIIPRGKELESADRHGQEEKDYEGNKIVRRVDIKSVNAGKEYVESAEGIKEYGLITKTVVWDDVEQPANLKTKAEQELIKEIFSLATIEFKAVDLSLLNLNSDRLEVNKIVEIISAPHEVDIALPISRKKIDLANADKTEITIGIDKKRLTDYVGQKTYISVSEDGVVSTDTNLIKWHDTGWFVNSVRFRKYGQLVIAFVAMSPTIATIQAGSVNKVIAKLNDKVKSAENFSWVETTPLFDGSITTSGENITANGSLGWHIEENLYNKSFSDFSVDGDFYKHSIYKITLTGASAGASIKLEFIGDEGMTTKTLSSSGYVQIDINCTTLSVTGEGTFNLKLDKMVSELELNASYVTTDTSGRL